MLATVTCPQCGNLADRIGVEQGGAVEETVLTTDVAHRSLIRKVRPATFWACSTCEWCAERQALPVAA